MTPTLSEALKAAGYSITPSNIPGVRNIVQHDEIVFTGRPGEVWQWLHEVDAELKDRILN